MRLAILLKDKCQPKNCSLECIKYCPRVRTGDKTVVIGEGGKPIISEELCVGCGICVHKCPFLAIKIINLAEHLKEDLVHQYSKNGFRLFRIPIPKKEQVIGILGKNGIGKTTAINILSGELIPNLGNFEEKANWENVLNYFKGKEVYDYFELLAEKKISTALKPQYVDKIPKAYNGKVIELLKKVNENNKLEELAEKLELSNSLYKNLNELSGGELQRVAILGTMLKNADIYFFDEPSSYLDIYQRLKIAKLIRNLAEEKQVVVIEHDLAIMDFISDAVHLLYGEETAYGICTKAKPVRNAINIYLNGFLKEENIRFREYEIKFERHPPKEQREKIPLIIFPNLEKKFEDFHLKVEEGVIHKGEVIGVLGANAIGKTTFVKILAKEIKADKGKVGKIKVSYKPQYIKGEEEKTVRELFFEKLGNEIESPFFLAEIERPFNIKMLYNKNLNELSGGELQKTAIALCLSQNADIYLIDEPSAYLDSNQRMETAKTIRRVMEKLGKSALVVEHDVYFIDLVADSIMVFSGIPSKKGKGNEIMDLRDGMNFFLKEIGITFRRDAETNRPRINKLNSVKDREQKEKGEYYYEGGLS